MAKSKKSKISDLSLTGGLDLGTGNLLRSPANKGIALASNSMVSASCPGSPSSPTASRTLGDEDIDSQSVGISWNKAATNSAHQVSENSPLPKSVDNTPPLWVSLFKNNRKQSKKLKIQAFQISDNIVALEPDDVYDVHKD